ncbi:hypothetical protein HK100_010169 [Physocladia obscura]|uniref:GH26 domain-containing protein n=1 Tax=Physocladia obscura TaxID=109957 RepID=A0AAD5XHA4_9FUNG|nr:hypothetical protein HK100_010169 [Physocladia obscura]
MSAKFSLAPPVQILDSSGSPLPSCAYSSSSGLARLEPNLNGAMMLGMSLDWSYETPIISATKMIQSSYVPAVYNAWLDITPGLFNGTGFDVNMLNWYGSEVGRVGGMLELSLNPQTANVSEITIFMMEAFAAKCQNVNEQYGVPIFLRYGHEMNGDWYPWGNAPTLYIASFRQFAGIIRLYTNMTAMVWAPNIGITYPFVGGGARESPSKGGLDFDVLDTNHDGVIDGMDDPYTPFYPGDDVVDWVGISLYYYPLCYNDCEVPANIFIEQLTGVNDPSGSSDPAWLAVHNFYQMFSIAHNKPLMLPESGSPWIAAWANLSGAVSETEVKQGWWSQIFSENSYTNLTKFRFAVQFEEIKPLALDGTPAIQDWRVTNNTADLNWWNGYVQGISSNLKGSDQLVYSCNGTVSFGVKATETVTRSLAVTATITASVGVKPFSTSGTDSNKFVGLLAVFICLFFMTAEPLDAQLNCTGHLLAVLFPTSIHLFCLTCTIPSKPIIVNVNSSLSTLPLSLRASIVWSTSWTQIFAVSFIDHVRMFRVDLRSKMANELHVQSFSNLQKCVWTIDGTRLCLLTNGKLRILSFSSDFLLIDSTDYVVPSKLNVRAALFVAPSIIQKHEHKNLGDTNPSDQDFLVVTFDMLESNIITDYDITGQRGWQSFESDFLDISSQKPTSHFNMNFGIPTAAIVQKFASSTLISVQEISRVELPIIMPDILLFDEVYSSIIVANLSVGVIFVHDFLLPSFLIHPKPTQVLRLEPNHFLMGASLIQCCDDDNEKKSQLVTLVATECLLPGKKSKSVTGFTSTPTMNVEVKVVEFMRSHLEASVLDGDIRTANQISQQVNTMRLQIFGQNNRLFGGLAGGIGTTTGLPDVDDEEGSSEFEITATGILTLPGHEKMSNNILVKEVLNVEGSEFQEFKKIVDSRLERLEKNQNEILRLLRVLSNNYKMN